MRHSEITIVEDWHEKQMKRVQDMANLLDKPHLSSESIDAINKALVLLVRQLAEPVIQVKA
jgi:hypothetical protein